MYFLMCIFSLYLCRNNGKTLPTNMSKQDDIHIYGHSYVEQPISVNII